MTTQLPPACAKPCGECPWRRESIPGWLGPFTAAEWLALTGSDEPVACHTTIEVDDEWTPRTRQCAGAAVYRRNVAKLPRNPEVAVAAERDTETIFATPGEFAAHHDRGAR
jgi:hypothetical protein